MFLKIFNIIPSWAYALIIGILLIFNGFYYVKMIHAQDEFSKYKLDVIVATQKAEIAARIKEQELQNKVDEVSKNAQNRENELQISIANSNNALNGLRNSIASAASKRAKDPASTASINEANVEGQLLGECAKEYRDLAEEADGLKNQVDDLQDYANSVSK